ncbi:MAG: Asp-tRNA(Asn)/Glu-tRNA(Gln) amidotransferase subunit GatA [Bacteroidota bacterium]|nr:Asp-tRNA(Asn)/Glu-tRNA(Gln) amidotransferase subunit GatA [Bacteroidota bacterium]
MRGYIALRPSLLSGEVRCERLVGDALDAARRNRDLNAFLEVYEDAVERAARVDAKIAEGTAGPLAGMIVALKDNLLMRGRKCTCASRILEGFESLYDATAVARLLAADAIVIGRTNMDEFAMGSSGEHSAFGPVLNPRDRRRVPGGSSSGAAAAVAAGIVHAALGSDTGGSVRQPAAFTGIVGVKPGYGRISRYGLVAFASSLDQIGTLTTTVADAALLLDVISGPDPFDATTDPEPATRVTDDLERPLGAVRVGLPREFIEERLDESVHEALERAKDALRTIGTSIQVVSLPHLRYTIPVYTVVAMAEASSNLARYDGVRYGLRRTAATHTELYERTRNEGFGPEVKRRILVGTYVLSAGYVDAYYRKAQQVRALIAREFTDAFRTVDILLGPTTPSPAFFRGERLHDPLTMYLSDVFTASANLAGVPAMHLPVMDDLEGLPIGVQLFAPMRGEGLMFRVASALERTLRQSGR